MARATDAFLAELGLERASSSSRKWGDDDATQLERAGLNHGVLSRTLEAAEALAPFLKLTRDAVFGLIRDLVLEEAQRSPSCGDEEEGVEVRHRFDITLAQIRAQQGKAEAPVGVLTEIVETDSSDLA